MIQTDCETCGGVRQCSLRQRARHCRETMSAFAHDLPAPSCPHYVEPRERGIEGVIPHPRPPSGVSPQDRLWSSSLRSISARRAGLRCAVAGPSAGPTPYGWQSPDRCVHLIFYKVLE